MPTDTISAQAPAQAYTISAQADTAQVTTTIHNKNVSLVLVTTPGGYHGTIKTTLELTTKIPLPGVTAGTKIEADFLEIAKNPAHELWRYGDMLLKSFWREELIAHIEYAYYLATP
jgi:predicted polyphosphate/ATP-dependent NAD kinase|nr:MAG TPA: hypothetical protein [Caudoviricetes sp.]